MIYDFSFESLSELKLCIYRGAEIVFSYNGREYSIGRRSDTEFFIGPCDASRDLISDNVEDILDFSLGGKTLRECVHEIDVIERTL